MSKENECKKLLQGIVGEPEQASYVCVVTAVSEATATCDVRRILDEKEIKKVRLNATLTQNDGLVILPKEKSTVLITHIDGDRYFVSQFSEIDKITLNVESDIEIKASGKIKINDGDNGAVKIRDLEDNLEKLRDFVNDLATNIYSWGSALDTLAGGVVTTGQTAWQTQADTFQFKDMEDTKILHS